MQKVKARKARLAVIGAACLAGVAAAPVAMTSLGTAGVELPGLSSAQQLMAMLDARSPGEREPGALTQTKLKQRLAHVPRERALGKIFPPKPSPVEQLAKVIVPAPPAPVVPPVVPLAPPTVADIISPTTLLASLPPVGGGGVVIGGGVLPPPTSNPPPPVTNVPPGEVVSPVPEPGTWLMMLLGFGMVGAAMKRRGSLPRAVTA